MSGKARVLLVGSGGIGTMTAFNLEIGGLASVTAVLRSNYSVVRSQGFTINSCDHGQHQNWRPQELVDKVPDLAGGDYAMEPFDYVICTTKNTPDVPPTVADLIRPAVTEGHSVIVLIQNGLNLEKPLLEAFPTNVCLSGVSLMGADELNPGHILQNDADRLYVGPFPSASISAETQDVAAQAFVKLYSASEKVQCFYEPNILYTRWRKLVYNAVLNPVCALTGLDTGRLRLGFEEEDPASPVNLLVRPAMEEVRAAASAAAGVDLPSSIVTAMINTDPIEIFCSPSMLQDRRKGRFIEYEIILGEALRDGEKAGVSMPILRTLYALCKAVQWRTMESAGLVDVQHLLDIRKTR